MHLHDTILSQSKLLKKSYASIRNYENQTRDAAEALKKLKLYHEEGLKREDEVWSKIKESQATVEKNWGVLLRNHELLERNELKNKGLQEE